MRIWDREHETYVEEKEFEKKKLEFLYQTFLGRILLKLIFSRRFFSEWAAKKQRNEKSVKDIEPFVKEYGIDMSYWEGHTFQSFDDFFTRKRNYKTDAAEDELIAAADARLSVYKIDEKLALQIKNSRYTIQDLIGSDVAFETYGGGTCLVYRLAVEDYHRYVYVDNGEQVGSIELPGVLHTVRPVSEKFRVFCRNFRVWNFLKTEHFGNIMQIEVGALLVGKIENHPNKNGFVRKFSRLQEKGYFRYGGSTIVQLFEKDRILIDEDILAKNAEGVEVKVHIGDKIGRVYKGEEYA